jgi:hypothetical protein
VVEVVAVEVGVVGVEVGVVGVVISLMVGTQQVQEINDM